MSEIRGMICTGESIGSHDAQVYHEGIMKVELRSIKTTLTLTLFCFIAILCGGCVSTGDSSGSYGGSAAGTSESRCGPCRGSGRCNTCNGTGRFLGTYDTSQCNTCSGSGVCINCGGRGVW